MPRYYNVPGGFDVDGLAKAQAVDEENFESIKKDLTKHHPFTKPHRDNLVAKNGQVFLKKPPMFCPVDHHGNPIPDFVPWEAGSISFGLVGYGFYVVPPNGHVDLDPSIPEKVIRDAAPHLLNEAEAIARGFLKPAADLKPKASPAKQP